MNTRKKGRKFEKQEEKVWKAAGWETELVRPEARFIGPGKFVTAYRDFFGRYDLLAIWPSGGVMCLVQVSTEYPSSHSDPGPFGLVEPPVPVGVVMTQPLGKPGKVGAEFAGVYEVYVQYIRAGRSYVARRTWWTRR